MAGVLSRPRVYCGRRPPVVVRLRRSARWAAVAIAILAATSPRPSAHAAGAKAEVTAAVADGFGRLVFTLPTDGEAEVRLAGGIVVIAFKQPVEINVDHIAVSMPGYISAARRDPDGTAVRLALTRKLRVNSIAAADRVYVDLLPLDWAGLPPGLPSEVIEDLSRRAREAERRIRQQPPALPSAHRDAVVRVRVATLPTFTRYTFELPATVAVATDRSKDRLSLTFDAPIKFDLADVKAALPASLGGVESEIGDDNVTVRFALTAKADVRTFREDAGFVVDVTAAADKSRTKPADHPDPSWSPEPEAASPAPPPAAPRAGSETPPPNQERRTAESAPARADPPVPASAAQPAASARVEPVQATAKPATPLSQPELETPAPAARASNNAPPSKAPVAAVLTRQGETLRLTFPFPTPTAAAVFRRADTIWLVFDTSASLDLARLRDDRTIKDVSVARSGDGQVVQVKLARSRLTSLATDGDAWIVTLGDLVLEPTAPLTVTRANAQSQASAAIPFDAPQRLHRLADGEAGGQLQVVTAYGPARGFLKTQDFVEFRALASSHGVVIEPLADDLTAEALPERIVISRPGGLTMTAALGSDGSGSALQLARAGALDAQAWGFDRHGDLQDRQVALMRAVAEVPEEKRNAARTDLARFYLAREMAPEAKGVLDVTLASERDPNELSAMLVLRGICHLMLGREDQTLKDLASSVVGNRHDAQLWRGIALSRLGRFAEAREALKTVQAASAGLPIELQRLAVVEAVRSAAEVKDYAEAARHLNDFDSLGVPQELKPTLFVLSGRVAEGLGRLNDALGAYRMAAESADEPAAAQARLRLITLRSTLKQVGRDEAVKELEMLTAGWRGDETELEALQLLARLYTEEGRYRDAFQVMRIGLMAHPRSELTRRMQSEAAASFESLFLGDRGEKLTPVEALGLFYDFRHLTPTGRRGDEMIRRLAERLIAMDLLTQAAELLQHQVDHRLQGAARAQVAARLASVYLMNRKPDRVLQVLRTTRAADLPKDVRQQRLLIEARALSDSGRHDLALEIAEEMKGREVERLRADVLWAARRWREAAEEIERMYGERWRDQAALDIAQRADLLRAGVGYALAEDAIGVDRLRQKYGPLMADGADRRMFDVVTRPLKDRSEEFGEIARAALSVDTLDAFLRDLRTRFPDSSGALSSTPPPRRG